MLEWRQPARYAEIIEAFPGLSAASPELAHCNREMLDA
jgi:hypothetical protein